MNPENADYMFRKFLEYHGIHHIKTRLNHSQTNGKIERVFGEDGEELLDLVLLKESYISTMRSNHIPVPITMNLHMLSTTDYLLNGFWDMPRGGCYAEG